MLQTVPFVNILGMAFSALLSFGVPIALCIWLKVRKKAKLSSFFIGCVTFVLFVLVLESLLHAVVLGAAGTLFAEHRLLYALYGGAAAAVFEETGRLLAMKFVMRKNLNRENALMYGAGHGGIEAMILVGIASVSNLVASFSINNGTMAQTLAGLDTATGQATAEKLSALWTTPGNQFFLGGAERLMAIALHIALSVLVYKAIKAHRAGYFLAALGAHFLVDFVTVLISEAVPLPLLELMLLVMVVALWAFVWRIYREDGSAREAAPQGESTDTSEPTQGPQE